MLLRAQRKRVAAVKRSCESCCQEVGFCRLFRGLLGRPTSCLFLPATLAGRLPSRPRDGPGKNNTPTTAQSGIIAARTVSACQNHHPASQCALGVGTWPRWAGPDLPGARDSAFLPCLGDYGCLWRPVGWLRPGKYRMNCWGRVGVSLGFLLPGNAGSTSPSLNQHPISRASSFPRKGSRTAIALRHHAPSRPRQAGIDAQTQAAVNASRGLEPRPSIRH